MALGVAALGVAALGTPRAARADEALRVVVPACVEASRGLLAGSLGVEVDVVVLDAAAGIPDAASWVDVQCAGDQVVLLLHRQGAVTTRRLELAGATPAEQARLLALSIGELLAADEARRLQARLRAEDGALHSASRAALRGASCGGLARRAVALLASPSASRVAGDGAGVRAQARGEAPSGRWSVSLSSGAWKDSTTDPMPQVALGVGVAAWPWLTLEVEVSSSMGVIDTMAGPVDALLLGGGGAALFIADVGDWRLGAGAGGRVGWLRWGPPGGTLRDNSGALDALWSGVTLPLRVGRRLGPAWTIQLDGELGLVTRGVVGVLAGDERVSFSGLWGLARLGVAWQL